MDDRDPNGHLVRGYFDASSAVAAEHVAVFARYGVRRAPGVGRGWSQVDQRFDIATEPHEPNRFGWVVELDPYDPSFTPRKRTMLGRFKHEGATVSLTADGRVAVYMGDDERFDYLHKFVSRDRFQAGSSTAAHRHNLTLLDAGTLYVARFVGDGTGDGEFDGTGQWVPLCSGTESFVAGMSVPQVLVHTRLAADQVGATKMDRPEDVERNPVTGAVYMVLTNNSRRTAAQVDEANPRPNNRHGHVIELDEAGQDAAATSFTWRIFLLCGDPNDQVGLNCQACPGTGQVVVQTEG